MDTTMLFHRPPAGARTVTGAADNEAAGLARRGRVPPSGTRQMGRIHRLLAGLFATVMFASLAACGGGGDDDDGVVCVGACPARGFIAIGDTTSAQSVAGALANSAANLVPNGTYNNQTVNGLSGSARVTGSKSYSGVVSCGTDCVSTSNSANLTIVFSDYYAQPPGGSTNTKVRITGTLTFTDNRSTRQQGLAFSSSGRMTVSGTGVTVRYEITDSQGRVYGYADSVATISTTSTTGSTWNDGSLRASNGVTYGW